MEVEVSRTFISKFLFRELLTLVLEIVVQIIDFAPVCYINALINHDGGPRLVFGLVLLLMVNSCAVGLSLSVWVDVDDGRERPMVIDFDLYCQLMSIASIEDASRL